VPFNLGFINRAIDFASRVLQGIDNVLSGQSGLPTSELRPQLLNPLDTSTFDVIVKTPAGYDAFMSSAYSYRVKINPKDPLTYKGVPYVTISTNALMTEEQIIALASSYVGSYSKYGGLSAVDSLTLVDAKLNPNLSEG
jgi:hypothetical protein